MGTEGQGKEMRPTFHNSLRVRPWGRSQENEEVTSGTGCVGGGEAHSPRLLSAEGGG